MEIGILLVLLCVSQANMNESPFEEQTYPNFSAAEVEEVSAAQIAVDSESCGDDDVEQTEEVMAPRTPQPKGKGKATRCQAQPNILYNPVYQICISQQIYIYIFIYFLCIYV